MALCGLIRPRAGKVFLGTYLCCSKKVLERKPEKSFLRSCFLSVADPGALHRSAVKAHPATARVKAYEMWESHSKKWHRALACRLCGLGVVRFSCAFKARSWASLKHRDQWEFKKNCFIVTISYNHSDAIDFTTRNSQHKRRTSLSCFWRMPRSPINS